MRDTSAATPVNYESGRAGREWTEEDVLAAFDRVFSGSSLAKLTRLAAHCLGFGLAGEAEDACQEFALRRFRTIVRRYDPVRGDFERFVTFCFRRWCRAHARILRRAAGRTRPLDEKTAGHAAPERHSPELRVIRTEARREVRRAVARFADSNRQLVVMRFWDESTVAEAAAAVGCTPGAARTRICRALPQLVPHLRNAKKTLGIGGAR
jgi:RNA polymerase sigma factor (sigma-70 family)